MSFVINLFTVCMALCGILMPKGLKEKIGFWQLLDSTQCFELLTQDTWYHLLTENQWFQTIFSETDHLLRNHILLLHFFPTHLIFSTKSVHHCCSIYHRVINKNYQQCYCLGWKTTICWHFFDFSTFRLLYFPLHRYTTVFISSASVIVCSE